VGREIDGALHGEGAIGDGRGNASLLLRDLPFTEAHHSQGQRYDQEDKAANTPLGYRNLPAGSARNHVKRSHREEYADHQAIELLTRHDEEDEIEDHQGEGPPEYPLVVLGPAYTHTVRCHTGHEGHKYTDQVTQDRETNVIVPEVLPRRASQYRNVGRRENVEKLQGTQRTGSQEHFVQIFGSREYQRALRPIPELDRKS